MFTAALILANDLFGYRTAENDVKTTRNPWQIGPSASYTIESQDLTSWAYGLHIAKPINTFQPSIKLVPELSYFHAIAHKIDGFRTMPLQQISFLFGPRFTATDNLLLDIKFGAHITGKHYVWNQSVLESFRTYNLQIGYSLKKNQKELMLFSVFYNHSYAMKHYTNFVGTKVQIHI